MNLRLKIIFLLAFLYSSCSSDSAEPEDQDFIDQLTSTGVKAINGNISIWYPMDSLSVTRAKEIVDSLALGVWLERTLINAPLTWQQFPEGSITYFLVPGNFVSHTTEKNEILIPLWRMRESKGPWLHESAHILLRSERGNWNEASRENTMQNRPLWLAEGLADYIAFKVSDVNHFPVFDIQRSGGLLKVDSTCKERLNSEKGELTLNYIGKKGVMMELFGKERREYAPIFYACSCSFVNFLSGKYGLDNVITANSEFEKEHESLAKLTGKSVEKLKEEWLDFIDQSKQKKLGQK